MTAAAAESAAEPTKGGGVSGLKPEQMPPPYRAVASLPRVARARRAALRRRRLAASGAALFARHTHRTLRPRSAASRPSGAARSLRTWWRYAGAAMRSELAARRPAYVAYGRWDRAIAAKRARVRYLAIGEQHTATQLALRCFSRGVADDTAPPSQVAVIELNAKIPVHAIVAWRRVVDAELDAKLDRPRRDVGRRRWWRRGVCHGRWRGRRCGQRRRPPPRRRGRRRRTKARRPR